MRNIPVLFVVPPSALLLDLAGPAEVLRRCNLEQDEVRFEVTWTGPRATGMTSAGLELTGIVPLPDAVPRDALVVVPGTAEAALGVGKTEGDETAAAETEIVRWLSSAIRPGMRLVCICSGALLAARAGLLDGIECTTHHEMVGELEQVAPRARVLANRLFVDAGERLTSAGVTAGIDLMLHLVAGEAGPGAALAVARHLVVYLRRTGADPQLSPWLEGRNHVHPAVHRLQDAIRSDPTARWAAADAASFAATSPRNLSRIFATHAGMSLTEYVNRLRLAVAREMLISTRLDMESVAERSGFASSRQFRRAWNRVYPTSPSLVRRDARAD